MRIRVIDTIGDLEADLREIPVIATRDMQDTVREMGRAGAAYAKGIARQKAGPHGTNYYKRLTAEMTGTLEGEYGPEGDPKTEFVGVGFRHGINTDLPQSADEIGPKFAKDVGDEIDGAFW